MLELNVSGVARSSDVDVVRPGVLRAASSASQSSTYVQQVVVGCVFGGALALSLLCLAAFVLCRRGRRAGRRAAGCKATAAAAVHAGAVRSSSTFRLFAGGPMTRDDSLTLTTSTGKTTSNGVSTFSNCSLSAAAGAADDVDDDDDYDVTTLARCFRFPRDVIQARQLPKPPPPPPHVPSPYQPHYLAGFSFLSFR